VSAAAAHTALAQVRMHLDALFDETRGLYDALARFDHEAVLTFALKSERTVLAVKDAEAAAVDVVRAARAAGADIGNDVVAVANRAAEVAAERARVKVLLEKARSFVAGHQRALLPPTTATAYGRAARAVVDSRFSSVRTVG
jgi:hypothetical protein